MYHTYSQQNVLGALTWPASWSHLKMAVQRPSVKYSVRNLVASCCLESGLRVDVNGS